MNGIPFITRLIPQIKPFATDMDGSGQALINQANPLGPDENMVRFLRSTHYPEFERQFRKDLALVREECFSTAPDNKYLDWFEKVFFDYRWPLKDQLFSIYTDIGPEVRRFAQGYRAFQQDESYYYPDYHVQRECISKKLCALYSSPIHRELLDTTLAACEKAVFPGDFQDASAHSVINRLCEKLSSNAESLNFSIFSSLTDTNERVYSVLDDFYFWIEAGNGRCRQPALNDLLSINFADCSPKAFRALAKQAIAHTLPEEGAVLFQCFEHTWAVNGSCSDLLSDEEIVLALQHRLEALPGLRAGLTRAIKNKQQAVTANLLVLCLKPEMAALAQAYLQNQLNYNGWFRCAGIKPSVKDKLVNLPAHLLTQFEPEFFTHELGNYDRQALIQHFLGSKSHASLEFVVRIMELGMAGDTRLTSCLGMNILGHAAISHYELLPRVQQLKGIDPNLEGKSGCFTGLTPLTIFIENCPQGCEKLSVIMDQFLELPGINVNHQNAMGLTPLMVAAKYMLPEFIERLLLHPEIKANINLVDHKNQTALMHASQQNIRSKDNHLYLGSKSNPGSKLGCLRRYRRCLLSLVRTEGIDLNCQDKQGRTALMLASERGFTTGLETLLEQNGLKRDFQDQDGNTALMLTVIKRKNHWDQCVKLLLESGVDLTCRNKAGLDAYELALKHCGEDDQTTKRLQQALNASN